MLSLLCSHSTLYKVSHTLLPCPCKWQHKTVAQPCASPSPSHFAQVLPTAASRICLPWFHSGLHEFSFRVLEKKNQMFTIHLPGSRPRTGHLTCLPSVNIYSHLLPSPCHRRELPAGVTRAPHVVPLPHPVLICSSRTGNQQGTGQHLGAGEAQAFPVASVFSSGKVGRWRSPSA